MADVIQDALKPQEDGAQGLLDAAELERRILSTRADLAAQRKEVKVNGFTFVTAEFTLEEASMFEKWYQRNGGRDIAKRLAVLQAKLEQKSPNSSMVDVLNKHAATKEQKLAELLVLYDDVLEQKVEGDLDELMKEAETLATQIDDLRDRARKAATQAGYYEALDDMLTLNDEGLELMETDKRLQHKWLFYLAQRREMLGPDENVDVWVTNATDDDLDAATEVVEAGKKHTALMTALRRLEAQRPQKPVSKRSSTHSKTSASRQSKPSANGA